MAKLSDVFLALLAKGGDALYNMTPPGMMAENARQGDLENARAQQEADAKSLAAQATLRSNFDFKPSAPVGKPTNLTDFADQMPQVPEGSTAVNLPGMGQGYLSDKPVYDVVVQRDKVGNVLGYKNIPRQRGGKTIMSGPTGTGADRPRQTQFVDNDGTPLVMGSDGSYTRAAVAPGITPTPVHGNESAIQGANINSTILPLIDPMYDAIDKLGPEPLKRLGSTSAGQLALPEIRAAKKAIQTFGFSLGGKNLTGTEAEIVFGAFLPDAFDNPSSRMAKRNALKGLLTGSMNLSAAANLLGPAGTKIRAIASKYAPSGNGQRPTGGGAPTLGSDPLGIL